MADNRLAFICLNVLTTLTSCSISIFSIRTETAQYRQLLSAPVLREHKDVSPLLSACDYVYMLYNNGPFKGISQAFLE